MPLRLEQVAADGVFFRLGREVPEVDALAGVGADAGGDEHEPGQQITPRRRRVGQEAPGLLGEVQQDGVAVEHGRVAVHDDGHFVVRVEGGELGGELLALAGVHGDGFVGQAGFLQEQGDLHGVGGEAVVKTDHAGSSSGGGRDEECAIAGRARRS